MPRLISRSILTVLATALVIAYAAGLASYLVGFLGPVLQAEHDALDWRFLYRGPVENPVPDVVLVTIDEASDQHFWAPMPRDYIAQVVTALHTGGAASIGLDFYLGKHSFDAYADELLQTAIREAGNVVLVSYLQRSAKGEGMEEVLPMPYFLEPALDHGYATFFTDTGVESVREGMAALGIDGTHALSLTGSIYAHVKGLDTNGIRKLEWSRREPGLPASDRNYRQVIDYSGPPFQYYRGLDGEEIGGIPAFKSHQIIGFPPPVLRSLFAGKIVLVGSGLSDAPDLYRTPFFSQRYGFEKTFGVEIHGHLLRTFLSADPLVRSGFILSALLVLLPAFVVGLATLRLRALWALPVVFFSIALVWVLGFYLFVSYSLIVPMWMPTLSAVLACLFGLVHRGSTEGRQRNIVKERFAPMLGETQLAKVLETPEAWSVEGEERVASILWARIRIPAQSRQHRSARETIAFYQDYWEHASRIIFKHSGTVFRYEEDDVVAAFGVPVAEENHAPAAALAAIDLAEAWLEFRKGRDCEDWNLTVGVDMGPCLVGELGTQERFAYRLLGHPVDRARALAERPLSGNGEIALSSDLAENVKAIVDVQPVERVDNRPAFTVVGRSGASRIGEADKEPNPFWKYLSLPTSRDDTISEDLLAGISLFADFTRQDLSRFRPLLFHRRFSGGERVFSQGEIGSAMYIIQSGSVDIIQERDNGDRRELLQRLNTGDFFGELALLSDLLRPASAVAYEPSELLVLFQSDLYDLTERQPEIGVRLIRALSRITGERLVQLYEELGESRRATDGENT